MPSVSRNSRLKHERIRPRRELFLTELCRACRLIVTFLPYPLQSITLSTSPINFRLWGLHAYEDSFGTWMDKQGLVLMTLSVNTDRLVTVPKVGNGVGHWCQGSISIGTGSQTIQEIGSDWLARNKQHANWMGYTKLFFEKVSELTAMPSDVTLLIQRRFKAQKLNINTRKDYKIWGQA